MAELDRANANPNPFMDCNLLTGASKRYPTEELRVSLAIELDRLLRETVSRTTTTSCPAAARCFLCAHDCCLCVVLLRWLSPPCRLV